MDKPCQLKDVELEILIFVTHKARKDWEEVEYEIASKVVPGCLTEGPVVSIYFEKRQACVNNEENVIDQLKDFDSIIVLWENQSIYRALLTSNKTYINGVAKSE